jgi:UDP-N-acetylglucosamine 1-carboxyvinyltransferase
MPKKLKITGGKPLRGEVSIGGAKNAATKMMIAALLTDEPVTLHNVPQIGDIDITAEILRAVGSKITVDGSTITMHTPKITSSNVKRLSSANRISVLAITPLLHRTGQAQVPAVGGDEIGPRPTNFHFEALAKMGAQIEDLGAKGYRAKVAKRLRGTSVTLPYPSVGATENIIMAAVLADGRTYIKNAAVEPEIIDVIEMLQQMGAIIEFRANRTIIIDGVDRLAGVEYTVIPDRLEAASYAMMAVATGGDILVKGARQEDLMTFLNTIRRIGGDYHVMPDGIRFSRGDKPLIGIELETDTHPGFATDWQQPMVVLLTQADGLSVVHETVWEDRFGYVEALKTMGASITVFSKCLGELPCRFNGEGHKHSAVIKGPTPLHAANVAIPDIRAGLALVVAALVAEGTSELSGLEHLTRGYEHLLPKLRAVGADFSEQ